MDINELQTREAFARVKQDIIELQQRIENASSKLEAISLGLSQFTDKKEFYLFVEAVRAEIDKLEEGLAGKKEFGSLKEDLKKSKASIENSLSKLSDKIDQNRKSFSENSESIEKRLKNVVEKEEEARVRSFNSANKNLSSVREYQSEKARELSSRIISLEKSQVKMHEELRELHRELRIKERQLERNKVEKKVKPITIPWRPLLIFLLVIIVVWAALSAISSITQPGNNQTTSNYSQEKINADRCLVDFECKESSPGYFYSNCIYDPGLDNCRCDTTDSSTNCLLDEKVAAQKRLVSMPVANSFGPAVLILISIAVLLLILWFAGRRKSASRGK
ncbi:MAG: hypothetical protein A2Y06_03390 [Omnitrophica WOR_2 bacterium GWA2_37_7]|nr:MAG: hypothetical protein A2Y06_03390 [Omnitrophica WOR_2 bacterium GWA2_37_7]